MNSRKQRIYLDHAATSWPKAPVVLETMSQFARDCGAAAGRGGYQSASISDRMVKATRRSIANLINAPTGDCISIHSNGTTALNAAIHGLLRDGDHVVTNAAEHNSVLRPLHQLKQAGRITLSVVGSDHQGQIDSEELVGAVNDQTRLVTLTHASNVSGCVQPIEQVGNALRDHKTLFLCDAAQTFGALPIDVQQFGIDLLAAPGHKASGGPLGTGFLFASPDIEDQIVPTIQGGTGSQSESLEMPTTMPEKLESGNLNVPALAGWNAELETLQGDGVERRSQVFAKLRERLYDGLGQIGPLQWCGQSRSLPIASILIPGYAPTDVAAILDAEFGIEVRAGMHCAALIHAYLGSESAGTIRLSAGPTTTESEIDLAVEAIGVIANSV